jgi:thiol-disulfide isomerase/thioredoxin
MKKRFILINFIILFVCLQNCIFAAETIFFHGSFSTAQEVAKSENKTILLDFTAKWCLPCRWMEKTVFNDQKVIDFAKENVIIFKVDVDDFDGINMKEFYKVNLLPTTLLMDSNGKILDRKEESMNSDFFISWISNAMSTHNIHPIKIPQIEAPKQIDPIVETTSLPSGDESEPSDIEKEMNEAIDNIQIEVPNEQKPEESIQDTNTNDEEELKEIEKILQENQDKSIEDKMVIPMNYFIQTGLFRNFENATRYAKMLDDKLNQNTSILSIEKDHIPSFQIALGAFETYEEASLFNEFLKSESIEGIVKKLN